MKDLGALLARFDPATGEILGTPTMERHLTDLRGCFHDAAAYESALLAGNPLIYSVATVQPGKGAGDLHYGIGRIMPGKVGMEYFMTKGHYHSWREAAELYIGIAGEGMMLLEEEGSAETSMIPLRPNQTVYVPGRTAHRTVNIGPIPLVYLGVYPAQAGHDYGAIGQRNFSKIVCELNGKVTLVDRAELRHQKQQSKD